MNPRCAARLGRSIWQSAAAFCLGTLLLASCVAQAPYEPPHEGAGSAGKETGAGGLVLAPSGGTAGAGGEAPAPDEPAIEGCRRSDECASPLPYCSVALARCVECLSQRNCAGTGRPYCDLQTGSCVYCVSDTQCAHTAPYCATALGACVECLSTENCGGTGLACDRESFHCVPTCNTHADCASSPPTPFCDPERNLCVACVGDQDCPGAAPRCAPATQTCVKCLADGDCPALTPRCDDKSHACVECVTNRDCQPGIMCVAGACANPK